MCYSDSGNNWSVTDELLKTTNTTVLVDRTFCDIEALWRAPLR
jgi:hypothetical protein